MEKKVIGAIFSKFILLVMLTFVVFSFTGCEGFTLPSGLVSTNNMSTNLSTTEDLTTEIVSNDSTTIFEQKTNLTTLDEITTVSPTTDMTTSVVTTDEITTNESTTTEALTSSETYDSIFDVKNGTIGQTYTTRGLVAGLLREVCYLKTTITIFLYSLVHFQHKQLVILWK